MARKVRNTAILAKIETIYGTDAVPVGATDAILISNFSANPLAASNVKRGLVRPYFGGSEELVGAAHVEISFDVELQGSGAAGTAPAWGKLLRACAFAEVVTAATRVDYTPISSALESLTIYYYDDGVLHKALGCFGDFTLKAGVGERPVLSFKYLGLDGGISAAVLPSVTLTAWKTPLVVNDANTSDILLGCTYATGALSGGTSYPSRGLEMSLGGQVVYTPLVGGESIDFNDRESVGKIQLDLTAANEVTFMAAVKANTTQGIGFVHGATAGSKVLIHGPAAQLTNPSKQDVNGRRLIGYDVRLVPVDGNDELRIVAL